MRLKHIAAAFAALGFTVAASAAETQSASAQLNYLQSKVTKLEEQMTKPTAAPASGKATGGFVTFDRDLSHDMLTFQTGVGTEMFLLHARHNGMASNSLYLGGLLRGMASYANSTLGVKEERATNGYAPLNVANPVVAKTSRDSTSSVTVPDARLMFVGTINDFTTGMVEVSKNSTDTLEINQAYLLLGNLDESMFFGTIGKKVPTFGNFSTYNTAYAPLTRTYFMPGSTNQASVGMTKDAFTLVATIMNGGSPADNLFTHTSTKLGNGALDLKYNHDMYGTDWSFGVGYLKGFVSSTRTVQLTTGTLASGPVVPGYATANLNNGDVVGAWDYNVSAAFDSFKVKAEYAKSAKKVNHKSMFAYNIAAMYDFQWMGRDGDVHIDYSAFSQDSGNVGVSATNSQLVLGFTHHCAENFQMGLEYGLSRYRIGLENSQQFSANSLALTAQANF